MPKVLWLEKMINSLSLIISGHTTGNDYIGEKNIDKKIRMLKFLQEHLKKEQDIDLIFVFEPGKGSFYSEYIPDRYFIDAKKETNYKTFFQKAVDYDLQFIDFNSYFMSIKRQKGISTLSTIWHSLEYLWDVDGGRLIDQIY